MAESESQPPLHNEIDAIPPESEANSKDPVPPDQPPIVAEAMPTPPPKKKTCTCRPDQTPWWKTLIEVIAAGCGVALVIITFYYTKAAYRQAHASETAATAAANAVGVASRTLTETQLSNQAQELANHASFQATVDNFQREERAYVFADSRFINISKDPAQTLPESLEVDAQWENSGTTPTSGLVMAGSYEYLPSKLPPNFAFPDLGNEADKGPHHALLGPRANLVGSRVSIPFSLEEDLADGKIHLYMWGWARYRDTFLDTKPHITKYCWEVWIHRVSGARPGPDVLQSGTTYCPTHNCYDDECKV